MSSGSHYYQVRKNDTLHVGMEGGSPLINTLPEDFVQEHGCRLKLSKIPNDKFDSMIKGVIYALDINEHIIKFVK